MVNLFIAILLGSLAVLLPVVSLIFWSLVVLGFFPYSRKVFPKVVFLKGADRSLRNIMVGMIPIIFMTASFISAGISIVGGYAFLIMIQIFDPSFSSISTVISLMSAGPIEESAKLLAAILIYLSFFLIWRKVPLNKQKKVKRDRVKDGMLFGLFVGASFGFLESLLYLFQNFITLSLWETSFYTLDPIIWRFVLGVMIHALYTGIASAGLGRSRFISKVMVTVIALSASVILHALNNGVQGVIILILEMDNLKGWLISDILQGILVFIGICIFIMAWRSSRKLSIY
jgi:RsiW-degrading membrane proteinase PrsW (M82 family)